MKTFHCDACDGLVFFENTDCLTCGAKLAYLPDLDCIGALAPASAAGDDAHWLSKNVEANPDGYRVCQNYQQHQVCNEAIPRQTGSILCRWCAFTEFIPDLSIENNLLLWGKLETAKRRLLYSLHALDLPLITKLEEPQRGLGFRFLANGSENVTTGHENGIITINIEEADDAIREKNRQEMREPYRTLLGHFRHEVGHYYWALLYDKPNQIEAFRSVFGDEREDYASALQTHYTNGAPSDWQEHFISEYATCHPWEDWAETWAHYLHMTDLIETASSMGLNLIPENSTEPKLVQTRQTNDDFETLLSAWFPITHALNGLNRSMGLRDGYPFVLSPAVCGKLRFIHQAIRNTTSNP
ncbi:MAG: hypothetical protein ACI9R3_005038 [Verrucomicrobiales bacterium]|jgi:hypothetical protein